MRRSRAPTCPNEYVVWLSPDDREQFEGYEAPALESCAATCSSTPAASASRSSRARRRVPDRRAPAARRVRHPGAARARRARARRGARARATTATRWSTRRRARSPSRCATPDPGAARAVLRDRRTREVLAADGAVARPLARLRHRARRPERLPPPRRGAPVAADRGSSATSARPTASRSTAAASHEPAQSLKPGDVDRARVRPASPSSRSRPPCMLDPVAVALKFGFLVVLYLFLLWVARSRAARPAPGGASENAGAQRADSRTRPACTSPRRARRPDARLRARPAAARRARRPVCAPGAAFELADGALLGRGDRPTSASRTRSPPTRTRGSSRQGDVSCSRTWAPPTAPT